MKKKQTLDKKLEQKLYKTVKKKILRKKIQQRIQKGQVLPVNALIPLGGIIAAGFTLVPITAAVAGWQIHKALKQKKQPPVQPEPEKAPEQLPEDSQRSKEDR